MKHYGIALMVLTLAGCSAPSSESDRDLSNLFRMQLDEAIAEFDKRFQDDKILQPKSVDVQGADSQSSFESITQMVLLNPDAEDTITIPLEMGYSCTDSGGEWTASGQVMIVSNPDPCSASIKLTSDAQFSTLSIGEVVFTGDVLKDGNPKELEFKALVGMSANVQVAESTGNLIAQELANQNLQIVAKQAVADLNEAIAQTDASGGGVEDRNQQLTIGSLDVLTSTTPVLGQSAVENVIVMTSDMNLSETVWSYPLIDLGDGETYADVEPMTNCEIESQRAPQLGVPEEFSKKKVPLEEEAQEGLGDIPTCPFQVVEIDKEEGMFRIQLRTKQLPVSSAGANRYQLLGLENYDHGLKDTLMYDVVLDVVDDEGEVVGKNVHTVILTLNPISPTKVDEAPLYNYIGSLGGSDYYLSANKVSLEDARDHAKRIKEIVNAQDAYVVTISSEEEQEFLNVNAGRFERYWIGYSDEVAEGVFSWDVDEGSDFTHWYRNNPNNHKNEDWVVMNWKRNDEGEWNDVRSPKYKFQAIVEVKK